MTKKFIGKIKEIEFFEFNQVKTVDLDTFIHIKDIKGFNNKGERVFFFRETYFQHWTGSDNKDFEVKQNEGVDLQEFKKMFDK